MPAIVGRFGRQQLFNQMANDCGITVGDNGRCERDATRCVRMMYSRFSRAMRTDFHEARPARPILYFDGTGGSLGKGIAHAELGAADFTGDCKQSRLTLSPLALYEGNDHALPLRANLTLAMDSFNKLCREGKFERDDGEVIACEPIVVGDMQGVKCLMGMAESCHSVWCTCRARGEVEGEGPQHQYGQADSPDFRSYDDIIDNLKKLCCEFKTEELLLACAHLSKGLVEGGAFTPFVCMECGYSPSAAQAKADLAVFNAMTDDEQKQERRKHVAGGRHYHVELYMGPMTRGLGMNRCGVDQLHLVYLNMFKHLFKYSIHEALPVSKQKVVRDYLKAAGFYSYDAADDSDDPVKRWIGREVKRFLHEADVHLPFLLTLACSEIDVTPETAQQFYNAAGEEEMDLSDDEFDATEEEIEKEVDAPSLLRSNATRWDTFMEWVRDIEAPWEEDSDEYRKRRALSYCNHARRCARDFMELKPTLMSWVPHIACNVVPRQIVELGNPSQRSADACESFGACAKKTIKHLTCRRRITERFRRGYVEQAFRRLCVRADKLLGGPENARYLQRSDERLMNAGCSNKGRETVSGPRHCIRFKVELELAEA